MTDPWTTSPTLPTTPLGQAARSSPTATTQHARGLSLDQGASNGHPLAQGLLAIPQWWDKEPRASVRLVPQKEGRWPGLKWTVYEVAVKSGTGQQDGPGVHRRYSEFAWLADCLVKRVRRLSPSVLARLTRSADPTPTVSIRFGASSDCPRSGLAPTQASLSSAAERSGASSSRSSATRSCGRTILSRRS
jgi:hypothetical protein